MTIPEHIEILRRGPRVWNAWRAENPAVVPDLAGIALSIGDRQMGPINGGPINLSRALLNEATLYFATLTGADLRGSNLTNADLRGARLEGVDLTGADLAGAQLDGASLAGAVLKAANLSGASLADVRDLTTDQIGEADGNLGTVLPYDLERPALWSVGQGTVHIETAYEAVEAPEDEPAMAETSEEPAPMSFEADVESDDDREPEAADEAEPEPTVEQPAARTAYSPTPGLPTVEQRVEPRAEPNFPTMSVPQLIRIMKRCGNCTYFVNWKNDKGGLCEKLDQRTTPDGRNCDKWKGIKYKRPKAHYE